MTKSKKQRILSAFISILVAASIFSVMPNISVAAKSKSRARGKSHTSVIKKKATGYITRAKFLKIKNGMSYQQVKAIIGSDGELLSEVGTKGSKYYTVMYDWKAADGISNATFEFQGGKLILKAQFGLK